VLVTFAVSLPRSVPVWLFVWRYTCFASFTLSVLKIVVALKIDHLSTLTSYKVVIGLR